MKNPFLKKARSEYESFDDQYDSDFMRGDDEDDGVIDESESAEFLNLSL